MVKWRKKNHENDLPAFCLGFFFMEVIEDVMEAALEGAAVKLQMGHRHSALEGMVQKDARFKRAPGAGSAEA